MASVIRKYLVEDVLAGLHVVHTRHGGVVRPHAVPVPLYERPDKKFGSQRRRPVPVGGCFDVSALAVGSFGDPGKGIHR